MMPCVKDFTIKPQTELESQRCMVMVIGTLSLPQTGPHAVPTIRTETLSEQRNFFVRFRDEHVTGTLFSLFHVSFCNQTGNPSLTIKI